MSHSLPFARSLAWAFVVLRSRALSPTNGCITVLRLLPNAPFRVNNDATGNMACSLTDEYRSAQFFVPVFTQRYILRRLTKYFVDSRATEYQCWTDSK